MPVLDIYLLTYLLIYLSSWQLQSVYTHLHIPSTPIDRARQRTGQAQHLGYEISLSATLALLSVRIYAYLVSIPRIPNRGNSRPFGPRLP